MYQTNQYEGMIAETITIQGYKGDKINAYSSRPIGAGAVAPKAGGASPPYICPHKRRREGQALPTFPIPGGASPSPT